MRTMCLKIDSMDTKFRAITAYVTVKGVLKGTIS